MQQFNINRTIRNANPLTIDQVRSFAGRKGEALDTGGCRRHCLAPPRSKRREPIMLPGQMDMFGEKQHTRRQEIGGSKPAAPQLACNHGLFGDSMSQLDLVDYVSTRVDKASTPIDVG